MDFHRTEEKRKVSGRSHFYLKGKSFTNQKIELMKYLPIFKQSNTISISGLHYHLKKTIWLLAIAISLTTACTETSGSEKSSEKKVDKPEGFKIEILAPHASFTDEVSADFRLNFMGNEGEPIERNLDDASTVIFAEATWEPGGTSGWHRHPGIAIVNIVEGEVESIWKRNCTSRTYVAGESFLDPGEIHIANNSSDSEKAKAYVTFLGTPDGEPATVWVEPVECP